MNVIATENHRKILKNYPEMCRSSPKKVELIAISGVGENQRYAVFPNWLWGLCVEFTHLIHIQYLDR